MKRLLIPFILSLFLFVGIASATMIYLDPQEIKGLNVGDTFNVNVNVKDVKDLTAYEFKIRYDTDLLDVDDIISSNFLNEPTKEIKRMIDEENGYLWYAMTTLNPGEPKSGSGTLSTVTFRVTGKGRSSLSLYDTLLSDPDAETIEHTVSGSVFDNSKVISKQTSSLFLVIIVAIFVAILLLGRKKPKKKLKK